MLTKSPEKIWKVHLSILPSMEAVNYYKIESSLKKKEIEVIVRRVSARENWYSIVPKNLNSKEGRKKYFRF